MAWMKLGWPRVVPEFFRKSSISFLLRFAGLFIQFLASIIVARALGASGYGAFTYAATWAVFVGTFLPFGMGDLAVRELPAYLAQNDRSKIAGYFIVTAVTLGVAGLAAAVALGVAERSGVLVFAPGWGLVAAYAVIHALVLTVSNGLNGFQRILTSQFLETVVRQVIYVALVSAAIFTGFGLTSVSAFELSLTSALPVLIVMMVLLWTLFKGEGKAFKQPTFETRAWLLSALPLLMTAVAGRLQLDLDVLMVGSILGEFEVGIYRAAARGAALVTIANMIALQLVGPMLSRALAEGDRNRAQKLLSQAALVSLVTGVPILLVFGFGAALYLGLYGPDFVAASSALRLLLVGQAALVLAGADAILLVMLRRERFVLMVTAVGVALNFSLNLALIRPLGIEGAALASVVSMVFVRLTLVAVILRTTGFDTTIVARIFGWMRRP